MGQFPQSKINTVATNKFRFSICKAEAHLGGLICTAIQAPGAQSFLLVLLLPYYSMVGNR